MPYMRVSFGKPAPQGYNMLKRRTKIALQDSRKTHHLYNMGISLRTAGGDDSFERCSILASWGSPKAKLSNSRWSCTHSSFTSPCRVLVTPHHGEPEDFEATQRCP